MSLKLAEFETLIETIDDIATDENYVEGSAQLGLDAIHKIIEEFNKTSELLKIFDLIEEINKIVCRLDDHEYGDTERIEEIKTMINA